MIIDAHAYCFPPLGEANGFPTVAEHLQYLQREMADHHQPVWRVRDRARVGDNTMLASPDDATLAGLKNVDFRSGGYGRFVWTVDGDDYAKQYLPPYLVDSSHPAETLIAQMDYVGIDRSVLHVNPIMGLLNDYVADCVQRFPNRLLGLASVKEWEIETDPEGQVNEIERAYSNGLHALQFIVNTRFRNGIDKSWNDNQCRPFWDGVALLGRPVLFTIVPPCPKNTLTDYLAQLSLWREWLERYPEVPAALTHGFPWGMFLEGNRLNLPPAVFEPFEASSAKLQLLLHISLGGVFDYPYTEFQSVVGQLVEKLGSERLMWGTDMPNVERFCNYRQTLDTFRVHCAGVIDDRDLENILGRTAADFFTI